jgi:phenylacetic acid degradation operon negative regulatory protein
MSPQDGGRSTTTGLVPFLFGVAGVPRLPGVVLTELLGEFGVGAAAARQQLARMRVEGQLDSVRAGRGASYRLAGAFAAVFERMRTPPRPPAWEGHFHALLFQVPEPMRAYRDRLRRQAVFAGYGILQPGVLIAPQDRTPALADVLAERPAGTVVRQVRIAMGDAEAVDAAETAWELSALGADLRVHADALQAALDEPAEPGPDAHTLRRLAMLVNTAVVEMIRDPGLPAQLYPTDWPGVALRAALDGVTARYGAPATAYVRSRIDAAESRR